MTDVTEWLPNGCQWGSHPLCRWNIIKSNNADIIGNAPPVLIDSPIDAKSLCIAGSDESAWWIGELQESLGLDIATLHAKITLTRIQRIEGKTGALQGSPVSGQTPSGDEVGKWTRNYGNPAVPKREQIFCSGQARCSIIGPDRGYIQTR